MRELRSQLHGEYSIVLSDGTEITSGRSYRNAILAVFGLCQQDDNGVPTERQLGN